MAAAAAMPDGPTLADVPLPDPVVDIMAEHVQGVVADAQGVVVDAQGVVAGIPAVVDPDKR
jgi:hypothetical protein